MNYKFNVLALVATGCGNCIADFIKRRVPLKDNLKVGQGSYEVGTR